MKILVVLFILLALSVPLLLRALGSSREAPSKDPTYVKKPLLTANEKEFFQRLAQALPSYRIFPQVAMGALISVRGAQGADNFRARGRFAQKIVDFVVCDSNLNVLGLIELDDRTHTASKDEARDATTREAGYWTLRYQSKAKPSFAEIAKDVSKKVGRN